MSQNPIQLGHAAWIWVDIRGSGKRWELAVPHEDDIEDEAMIRFPLADFEDYAENYEECQMIKVEYPDRPGVPPEAPK